MTYVIYTSIPSAALNSNLSIDFNGEPLIHTITKIGALLNQTHKVTMSVCYINRLRPQQNDPRYGYDTLQVLFSCREIIAFDLNHNSALAQLMFKCQFYN